MPHRNAIWIRTLASCCIAPVPAALPLAAAATEHDATSASTIELSPVVVTGSRVEAESFHLPFATYVVDQRRIQEGQLRVNASEALGGLAGVVVQNRQNYAQDLQISIRGFGARSAFGVRGVKLIADGIPATNPDGQGQAAPFNLDTAERIEVMRGPLAYLYGNASGGLIQLFTAHGPQTPEIGGEVWGGSYGSWRAALRPAGQFGPVNFIGDLSRFSTDGYRDHSATTRDQQNAVARLRLPDDSKLNFVVNALNQVDTQDPLGLTRAQAEENPRQAVGAATFFNTRKSIGHAQFGAAWDKRLANGDTLQLSAYVGERDVRQYLALSGVAITVEPAATTPPSPASEPAPPPAEAPTPESEIGAPLDPRCTFEAFVVGKPNELAFAAAKRVAELETPPFNPLFIYGGVGLGKTHLMHAIAWEIRRLHPHRKVVYLSAEKFMYQFIKALRYKDTMSFKELFRSADVLMVDDVQFIGGKESTQEEFFHTFNALADRGRQIVISSDRSPPELAGLEERIRSRLGWGLVADIQPTTYELRLGILQAKAQEFAREARVPDNVLAFLAHRITSNVRELEGALNRVIAQAILVGRAITLEMAQDVLRDLLRAHERRVTIEDIQKLVAEHYRIRIADMHSARRARAVARPRQVAMYLAKQLTPRSLPEIGRKFGGRDHTTVMHAVRRIDELKATDHAFAEDVDLLRRMLES